MASTAISDIIVPQVFAPYALEQSLARYPLLNGGIISLNPALSANLAGGGLTFNFPSFRNVDESATAANVSNSDAASAATPEKMVARSNIAVRMERNKVWSSTDLTAAVAGADPLAAVAAYAADAINKWRNASLFSVLGGVMNETVMASSVNTIASESIAGASAATKYSADALIDTMSVWGDSALEAPMLVMHSDMFRKLQKSEPNAFVPVSSTNVFFPTYLGFPVMVQDTYTKRAGTTDGSVYTIYMVKPGAIEMGVTQHANAVEVERSVLGGNGGGAELLAFRDIFTFHIVGTKFTSASVAGDLPTDGELATAANWNAVYNAKGIGVAALVCNL